MYTYSILSCISQEFKTIFQFGCSLQIYFTKFILPHLLITQLTGRFFQCNQLNSVGLYSLNNSI